MLMNYCDVQSLNHCNLRQTGQSCSLEYNRKWPFPCYFPSRWNCLWTTFPTALKGSTEIALLLCSSQYPLRGVLSVELHTEESLSTSFNLEIVFLWLQWKAFFFSRAILFRRRRDSSEEDSSPQSRREQQLAERRLWALLSRGSLFCLGLTSLWIPLARSPSAWSVTEKIFSNSFCLTCLSPPGWAVMRREFNSGEAPDGDSES